MVSRIGPEFHDGAEEGLSFLWDVAPAPIFSRPPAVLANLPVLSHATAPTSIPQDVDASRNTSISRMVTPGEKLLPTIAVHLFPPCTPSGLQCHWDFGSKPGWLINRGLTAVSSFVVWPFRFPQEIDASRTDPQSSQRFVGVSGHVDRVD